MMKENVLLHGSAILPEPCPLPEKNCVNTLPPLPLQAARTAPHRTASRRTSYPASGSSSLIGSGRATACASHQLLIGLSRQVVRVTSAYLPTIVGGRWGNSGERHRRQLQPPRVRHQADTERTGASAHGWMRNRHLLACPHGRNNPKLKPKWFGGIFEIEERSDGDFLITWAKTPLRVAFAPRWRQELLHRRRHIRSASAPKLSPFFLLVCGRLVVRVEPWAARWAPRTRLPRRDPKWLTRTSEKTERRRPERWSCCCWVGRVWRFETVWTNYSEAATQTSLTCCSFMKIMLKV